MGRFRARSVRGPATPSAVRPFCRWKSRTADSVAGPKSPSSARHAPWLLSACWRLWTRGPCEPRERTIVPLLVVVGSGAVPVLPGARELLQRGFVPAGTLRNAAAFRKSVDVKAADEEYTLLADAQTSGGLLMAVAPGKARLLEEGFSEQRLLCARIGEVNDRSGRIELVP